MLVYIKLKKLPSYLKAFTWLDFLNYNYICFFARYGFLKFKFKKKDIEVVSNYGFLKFKSKTNKIFKTYFTIIKNIVVGLKYKYSYYLKVIGLGFKYKLSANFIFLILGYSHVIKVKIPRNIQIKILKKRKIIKITSHDKFLLRFFIFHIKKFRPLDIYKAKGIRFKGEVIVTKVGKSSTY